jgi:DNA topoisomerase-6 subunit B
MVAKPRSARTADDMAGEQRDISVSEFFVKNQHLLGFDGPIRALLTTVKEGVDNALDACEEAGILPEIHVQIRRAGEQRATATMTAETSAVPLKASATQTVSADAPGTIPSGLFQRNLFQEEIAQEEAAAQAADAARKEKKSGRKVTDPPERLIVSIEDNGPGIVEANIGKVFGKLLYGSKFHRLKQQRGQQGIGISAAGMYGQLTTGKPVLITSRTHPKKKAHYMEVSLDLQRNQPEIRFHEERDWAGKATGTLVEIELEAKYQKGQRSVDTYIRATALANPHVTIVYRDLDGNETRFDRATKKLPEEAREVQPHPYGVELGVLLQMLKTTQNRQLGAFLENEFSRVSKKASDEICALANLNRQTWVARVAREEAAALHVALGKAKLMNPPTDCVSPIGEGLLIDSLHREYPEAFIRAVTRSPAVYRGNPFQVEVAIAYGGGIPADQPANLLRYANRVPLLYQQGACLITKAVQGVPWKKYGLEQPRGSLPVGPVVLVVHIASVWVPFTSEAKEAVAHYDQIHDELRFALMQLGRMLKEHVSKTRRVADEMKKREYISKYIPKISEALQQILEFDDKERDRTTAKLTEVLNRRTI